jgi:peptidoglycan/xylan/chitin deacetylase (PgdA/CDA1 family)/GT2 family glycosyltransferase/SAM-dependent methyltransferase
LEAPGPLISVVIPARDREATIARTLDSLLAQTYEGWEAIVVDDGSGDRTAAVVEQYGQRDARFGVQRQPHGGVSAARNAGIGLARRPWLFFLDADDWIVPTAFEALLGAVGEEHAGVSAVYGGYVRVDQAGREVRQRRPPHAEDLFPVFATTCAFAVHTCLIRTELIRSVGGFDQSLVTCEDWDLWQRVARTGARFAAIPDYIAYYRMRPTSASANGARMLGDGLRVIDRGHGEDPRLAAVELAHRNGAPAAGRVAVRAYFACYAAGLVIAAGGDPRWMLSSLGSSTQVELDPAGVADTLFHAVANGRASAPEGWPAFAPELLDHCRAFLDALGEWAQDSWLGFQGGRALERMVLAVADGTRPRTVGAWQLVDVDCDADPPAVIQVEPSVRRVLCTVRAGGRERGTVELPLCDGWLPPRVLADGIAAELAWELLRARLERDVYCALEVERDGARVRVRRGDCLLLEEEAPREQPFDVWLHDRLGWTVLLQELWGRPAWLSDWFYSERPEPGDPPHVDADGDLLAVELTAPLPSIACAGGSAAIGVTLAGVPLVTLCLPATRGRIEPHEVRRAALLRLGFELCRAVVRETILAPAAPTLHASLTGAASARAGVDVPASRWADGTLPRSLVPGWQGLLGELLPSTGAGTVIARRAVGADGTGVSRYAVLPAGARAELLAGARNGGDPVLAPDGANPEAETAVPLVYVPGVQWDRSSVASLEAEDQALLVRLQFEQTFAARPDPWSYASDYEQRKYEQTLALVPAGVGSALELGCAEGAFSANLAAHVGSLLACDVSTVALSRAARRCSDRPNVAFRQLDLFQDELPRGHDLIVCSELLYYAASRAQLDRALHAIADALEPGGQLLMANANVLADERGAPGFDWDVPFGAKGIGAAVLATGWFELEHETRTAPYRIQSFRRRARRRVVPRGRGRRAGTQVDAEAGEMTAEAAARYSPSGEPVRIHEPELEVAGDQKLPVLMYHRIAAGGVERTQRWRLHPEAFEQQLAFLRDAGFYSVSFEQWRAAANMRRPLPGKPIVLTFDDGYADFPEHVPPLLFRYGFRATVFIVPELVGQSNVWDAALGEPLPLMDWATIERLATEGIDFGSHSTRHRPLVALEPDELAADLARSRRLLEQRLGHPVTSLSYPFGLYDATVRSLAAACGYEYAVTTDGWQASWSDSLLTLPRLEVLGTASLDDFVAMLRS